MQISDDSHIDNPYRWAVLCWLYMSRLSKNPQTSYMMCISGSPMSWFFHVLQGVLFFELFHPVTTGKERFHVLSGLRHRQLPLSLLSERPQEAEFVLALLHPDPASRPSAAKLMQPGCLLALQSSIVRNKVWDCCATRQAESSYWYNWFDVNDTVVPWNYVPSSQPNDFHVFELSFCLYCASSSPLPPLVLVQH